MHKDQRLAQTFRIFTAGCGVLAILGAYTIAFAEGPMSNTSASDITNSNIVFGR